MLVAFFWDSSLFEPRTKPGNPYGGLLVEALRKRGVSFELVNYRLEPGSALEARGVGSAWLWRNRRHVDVIHYHWLQGLYSSHTARGAWLKLGRLAWYALVARALGYRVVWTLHNLLPHERPHRFVDATGRFVMAALANAVICHCEFARREFTRRFKRWWGIHVIPHGNFITAYPNAVSRDEARTRLDIPLEAFVYVTFGNIRQYKGHDALLRAFRRLQGDGLRLLIAGARHRIFQSAPGLDSVPDPRVVIREGFVAIEDVQVYFNAADVGVFPYRTALTSGAVINALGFSKPVISTRVGCIPELVNDAAIGMLVAPGDEDALHEAMLAAQGWDLDAMGGAARRRAEELDWDAIAGLTLAAYGAPVAQN